MKVIMKAVIFPEWIQSLKFEIIKMHRTRGSYILGTSQDEDSIPNPPPVPTNLADAITALVNVTTENSRLLHEIAQSNQN
jgi:hypothetical protein